MVSFIQCVYMLGEDLIAFCILIRRQKVSLNQYYCNHVAVIRIYCSYVVVKG